MWPFTKKKKKQQSEPMNLRKAEQRNSRALATIIDQKKYGLYDSAEEPANDDNFLLAYNQHPWLNAAVSVVNRNSARVPKKLYKIQPDGSNEMEEVTSGQAFDLLEKPNIHTTWYDFMAATAGYYQLAGDVYWEKSHPILPKYMWMIEPTKMKVIPDARDYIREYQYTINGKTEHFAPEEIVHLKTFNPKSEFYGTSKVRPITNTLITDFYAQTYKKNFFENGGHISTLLKLREGLNQDEFDRVVNLINDKYSGSGKAFKWAVFENVDGVEKLSVNPDEADLSNIQEQALREILSVIGVPRMLVQDSKDASWANAKEQMRTFWLETIIPMNMYFQEIWDVVLAPFGVYMEYDYSWIDALREDQKAKAEAANIMVNANIMTINEAREKFNLDPVPWGNVARFPFNVIESEEFKKRKIAKSRQDDIIQYNKLRDKFEDKMQKLSEAYFKTQQAELNKGFDLLMGKETIIRKDIMSMALDSMTAAQDEFIESVLALETSAAEAFSAQAFKTVKGAFPKESIMTDKLKSFISDNVTGFVREADTTTKKRLQDVIQNAVKEDMPLADVQKKVAETFSQYEKAHGSRSRVIARTEMAKVSNAATQEGYEGAGVKTKIWIAAGPPDDREHHTAADGMEVPVGDFFTLDNGAQLRFPGDPLAGVEEVANCRCTLAAGQV